MVVHIALYKWKTGTPQLHIQHALAAVTALINMVPGIVEIVAAENQSKFSEGYTHVILVRAESPAAIEAYRAHPAHVMAAQQIDGMEEQAIGVDFEIASQSV
jgi:hypothetical protein